MAKKKKQRSSTLAPKRGEKTIEIKLRFWTNNITTPKGTIAQKHGWTSGTIAVERNSAHGIKPGKAKTFNSLLDIGAVVEKLLIEHGIVLRPSKRMGKYLE